MPPEPTASPPRPLVRALLRATLAALTAAALAGVVVLAGGDVDGTGGQVLLTSLVFAATCILAAGGADLLQRGPSRARPLGPATVALAAGAGALVCLAIWLEIDAAWFARLVLSAVIVAVEASYASFVLARRRVGDDAWVGALVATALVTAVVGGAYGIVLTWAEPDDAGGHVRLLGAIVIVQVFAAVAAPLQRRLHGRQVGQRPAPSLPRSGDVAGELEAVAARLESCRDVQEAHGEARRLRELARELRPTGARDV